MTGTRTGPVPSAAVSSAIELAVIDELAERGVTGLSIDGVARRAGVGKAAIYRRWPGKREMVVEVICALGTRAAIGYPDTGSLTGDLLAGLEIGVRQLRHPLVARIVPDMLAEGARDPRFAVDIHERMGRPRRRLALEIVDRAVLRGELPSRVDRALAADLIVAPVYWRLLVTREPFDLTEDGPRLIAAIVAGIRASTTT